MRQCSLWDRLDKFPPVLIRLLARTKPHGPVMATSEIARRSGLTSNQVAAISEQVSWDGIDVCDMRAFMKGCNLDFVADPVALDRMYAYLRKSPNFKHLRVSPQWAETYEPLLRRYWTHISKKALTHESKNAGPA